MSRAERRSRQICWAAAIVLLVALIVIPFGRLLLIAAEDGAAIFGAALAGSAGRAVFNTLLVCLAVTALAVTGGLAAALAIPRAPRLVQGALRLGTLMPLLVPPFVTALGWVRAYGPAALLDDTLGVSLPGIFGPLGVVLVLAVSAVPLAYLVVSAGLATRAEPDLERAARVHGASAIVAFRSVTLPLIAPSLGAAAALVFATSANAFGVPAVLGLPAGFATVTTHIYRDLAFSADPGAFQQAIALATLLVALTLAALLPVDARRQRGSRTGGTVGSAAPAGHSWPVAAALAVYVVLTAIVPLGALILTSLTRAVGVPPTPANWTLANFGDALSGRAVPALVNSLLLAIVAASCVVAMGALAAWLRRGRGGRVLGSAVVIGFALPGSALAIGVLLTYAAPLRDSLTIILFAYLAKFWALGLRPLAGAVDRLPSDLTRAARASGAGAVTVLRTIALPLLAPVLGAGWLLAFLFSMHELTMSSLLYGPGSETLAVVILNLQQLGDPTVTAALAVVLTLIVLIATLPLRGHRLLSRSMRGLE